MCNGSQVEEDAGDGAVLRERALGVVGAVARDDVVRHAVAHRDVLDESDSRWPVRFLDWPCFDPFCELVHRHQQMRHAASSGLEGPHHVESPDHKGPCDWDGLECRRRLVDALAEALASLALEDE